MRGILTAIPVAFAVSLAFASCGFETRNWDFCSTGSGVGGCARGTQCDTTSGSCVPITCDADEDCVEEGERCDLAAGQCVPQVGVACADGGVCSSEASAEGAVEAAADAATEGGLDAAPESAPDVGIEAGPDVGPEVGRDVGPEVGPDVGPEGPVDAGPDVTVDAGPDVTVDAGPDGPVDAGPDVPVDTGPPCGGPCPTGLVCNSAVNMCTQCIATTDCGRQMTCNLITFMCGPELEN